MMGGVHTDIDGATPARRALRRGRDRLREHQRRQPAGLQLAAGVPGLRCPGRPGGRGVRRSAGPAPAAIEAQAADEVDASSGTCSARPPPGESGVAAIRDEMQSTMEDAAGIYRTGPEMAGGRRPAARAAGEGRPGRGSPTPAAPSTPSCSPRSSWPTCSTSARPCSSRGCAGGVEGRPPAHRLPGPRRREDPHAPAGRAATPTGRRGSVLPVTITRWPPGERAYGR